MEPHTISRPPSSANPFREHQTLTSISTIVKLHRTVALNDAAVRFSGRTVHCHKLVLCTNSEYFKKLVGPGSHFAEAHQNVVELEEDHLDAVEHILRYIYSQTHNTDQDNEWKLQLEVAKAAEKYLLFKLAEAASLKFKNAFETDFLQIAQDLESIHLLDLLKLHGYRELVNRDKMLMWSYLDQVRDFMSGQVEVDLAICNGVPTRDCHGRALLSSDARGKHVCSSRTSRDWKKMRFWAPKKELSTYKQLFNQQ
ncbi:Putative ankyrin repeat and BTB/POZ domain-containing protein [Septoria linicola]|uniref:Ankyrin repeat and BTB/POZ domain-containing protein n=1 Tax=Septoria linicola TaxID=215465 RepID=A0A9Q9AWT9_9PEZI|nr:putative ankyrin repeat and BTB/POZ domain-containing protein [Septoria linicola]USW53271.1 Putative ankyrin repeat and BTB/POZ domain-containing protein [Septoria linicola]